MPTAEDFIGRIIHDDPATIHDNDAIRKMHHLINLMLDQDDRHILFLI